MSDTEHEAAGLELLLPDPELIARLAERRRADRDEVDDDDFFEPPHAA